MLNSPWPGLNSKTLSGQSESSAQWRKLLAIQLGFLAYFHNHWQLSAAGGGTEHVFWFGWFGFVCFCVSIFCLVLFGLLVALFSFCDLVMKSDSTQD